MIENKPMSPVSVLVLSILSKAADGARGDWFSASCPMGLLRGEMRSLVERDGVLEATSLPL